MRSSTAARSARGFRQLTLRRVVNRPRQRARPPDRGSSRAALRIVPCAQEAENPADPRRARPQDRGLLDPSLEPPPRPPQPRKQGAARRRRGDMMVNRHFGIAPFAFVALIADREVGYAAAPRDRVAHELVQVRGTGPEARHVTVVVAPKQMIVAAAV